jgi:hypothetical protein
MHPSFAVIPLRFHVRARREVLVNANFIRGRFGKALRRIDPAAYHRLFAPSHIEGPSGLRDAPRPFVIRVRERSVAAGDLYDFGFHLFDPREPVPLLARACEAERVEAGEILHLPLEPARPAARIRVTFLTPTELKNVERPEFAPLFARVRDRISTLRSLYQGGPLDVDFNALGRRAARVEMTRCELQHVAAGRTSRQTGHTHSLGGFVGVAEYAGDLGEFLPYLEIARWTGVGRQTVWGKGEIVCETF